MRSTADPCCVCCVMAEEEDGNVPRSRPIRTSLSDTPPQRTSWPFWVLGRVVESASNLFGLPFNPHERSRTRAPSLGSVSQRRRPPSVEQQRHVAPRISGPPLLDVQYKGTAVSQLTPEQVREAVSELGLDVTSYRNVDEMRQGVRSHLCSVLKERARERRKWKAKRITVDAPPTSLPAPPAPSTPSISPSETPEDRIPELLSQLIEQYQKQQERVNENKRRLQQLLVFRDGDTQSGSGPREEEPASKRIKFSSELFPQDVSHHVQGRGPTFAELLSNGTYSQLSRIYNPSGEVKSPSVSSAQPSGSPKQNQSSATRAPKERKEDSAEPAATRSTSPGRAKSPPKVRVNSFSKTSYVHPPVASVEESKQSTAAQSSSSVVSGPPVSFSFTTSPPPKTDETKQQTSPLMKSAPFSIPSRSQAPSFGPISTSVPAAAPEPVEEKEAICTVCEMGMDDAQHDECEKELRQKDKGPTSSVSSSTNVAPFTFSAPGFSSSAVSTSFSFPSVSFASSSSQSTPAASFSIPSSSSHSADVSAATKPLTFGLTSAAGDSPSISQVSFSSSTIPVLSTLGASLSSSNASGPSTPAFSINASSTPGSISTQVGSSGLSQLSTSGPFTFPSAPVLADKAVSSSVQPFALTSGTNLSFSFPSVSATLSASTSSSSATSGFPSFSSSGSSTLGPFSSLATSTSASGIAGLGSSSLHFKSTSESSSAASISSFPNATSSFGFTSGPTLSSTPSLSTPNAFVPSSSPFQFQTSSSSATQGSFGAPSGLDAFSTPLSAIPFGGSTPFGSSSAAFGSFSTPSISNFGPVNPFPPANSAPSGMDGFGAPAPFGQTQSQLQQPFQGPVGGFQVGVNTRQTFKLKKKTR